MSLINVKTLLDKQPWVVTIEIQPVNCVFAEVSIVVTASTLSMLQKNFIATCKSDGIKEEDITGTRVQTYGRLVGYFLYDGTFVPIQ